ncbi:histidinol-phosphate transaminase [Granulicella sp. S190]|uniref:pyridoxal phosphate-dependent aminotransferase n=1 Tax=Granulicella sp. S190 TaxID=1747226 RepID=UPI00131BFBEA|nr:aminotransferase class I/II-fold pyridoxal phosphate-dependent enzyme [Granulicella sp. S190]
MNTPPRTSLPAHGGQLREIATKYGIEPGLLLDFSANINPAGPPASVLTALQRAIADPATLITYPDLELTDLKGALAEAEKIQPENIAAANGFVPLLVAAIRSFKVSRCLLPIPSFSEYRRSLENAEAAVVPYSLSQKNNFAYEPDELIRTAVEGSCDAILLANPQNPSGVLCPAEEMKRLVKLAADNRVTILLDEAFADYTPTHSLIRTAVEQPNLIVFRSVTKFFATPSLRVAYAVSGTPSIQSLNRILAPWPITSFAADAVCAALQDEAYAQQTRMENTAQRIWLERELCRLNLFTYPSEANFLLLRFPAQIDVAVLWEEMIVKDQIVLRSCANFEGLATGHLRVAVRSAPDNKRLIQSLERMLRRMAG